MRPMKLKELWLHAPVRFNFQWGEEVVSVPGGQGRIFFLKKERKWVLVSKLPTSVKETSVLPNSPTEGTQTQTDRRSTGLSDASCRRRGDGEGAIKPRDASEREEMLHCHSLARSLTHSHTQRLRSALLYVGCPQRVGAAGSSKSPVGSMHLWPNCQLVAV